MKQRDPPSAGYLFKKPALESREHSDSDRRNCFVLVLQVIIGHSRNCLQCYVLHRIKKLCSTILLAIDSNMIVTNLDRIVFEEGGHGLSRCVDATAGADDANCAVAERHHSIGV